jgi:hypothetical protein
VRVARPKLRGTSELFASRLLGAGITKSNALETLVIASFVRGLSVRDVEATLADALGVDGKVSKSECACSKTYAGSCSNRPHNYAPRNKPKPSAPLPRRDSMTLVTRRLERCEGGGLRLGGCR